MFMFTGIFIRMAASILANICVFHGKNSDIHNLGIGQSATMEFAREIDAKCIIIDPNRMIIV